MTKKNGNHPWEKIGIETGRFLAEQQQRPFDLIGCNDEKNDTDNDAEHTKDGVEIQRAARDAGPPSVSDILA